MRATRKNQLLALLSRIRLDDANAAQRLSQPAGDFRIDLPAVAEQWSQLVESRCHDNAESSQRQYHYRSQPPVHIKEHDEYNACGHHTANKLDQAGADEITYALGVSHDA